MSNNSDENDSGAPLPNFNTSNISLQTIAPALGVSGGRNSPDYLDYDPKGRGIVVTMFANTGMSYLIGTAAGGVYGFRQGLAATPSNRFRVQLNSVLNHSGRYGSRAGNTLGVFAILYSLYEGLADNVSMLEYASLMTLHGYVLLPIVCSRSKKLTSGSVDSHCLFSLACYLYLSNSPTQHNSSNSKKLWVFDRFHQLLRRLCHPALEPPPLESPTLHRRDRVWPPLRERLALEP
jgi:hypothetical protein